MVWVIGIRNIGCFVSVLCCRKYVFCCNVNEVLFLKNSENICWLGWVVELVVIFFRCNVRCGFGVCFGFCRMEKMVLICGWNNLVEIVIGV